MTKKIAFSTFSVLIIALIFSGCQSKTSTLSDVSARLTGGFNAHQAPEIQQLLSDNCSLQVGSDSILRGHSEITSYLENTFSQFPDIALKIDRSIYHETTAMIQGHISGSLFGNKKKKESFDFPMLIQADITSDKVTNLQFYGDFSEMRNVLLARNSPDTNDISVQGFGGVFFQAKDPKTLAEWYNTHLGTSINDESYMVFKWRSFSNPSLKKSTAFGIFKENSEYYAPSKKPFMFNFRVNNLDKLMEKLRREGVQMVGEIDRYDYGNFGWIIDPEGNKIELWEPRDSVLEAYEETLLNK